MHISLGQRVSCQHGAFSGVGAFVASFAPAECPKGYVGYIRKALEKDYLEHPGSACCTDDMFEIFVPFGQCVCCLLPLFVNRQLLCLYTNSHNVLLLPPMRHKNLWWLDFGKTPNPENLEAHPGFVWVKSGYSEAIPWRKVQLTKQRNVDLTTDGLWAMPLNTGWVPVKPRRLQDWEKLKKYVPSHKQGDVCPNGVLALVQRGNDDNESDSE